MMSVRERGRIHPVVWVVLFETGLLCCLGLAAPVNTWAVAKSSPQRELAHRILEDTNIKGGLIVHLGCGNGILTTELAAAGSFLVHGLDSSVENIGKARAHIQESGRYGPVSVEVWSRPDLPYVENLVNLFVSADLGAVAMDEVLRILAPNGAAYIKQGDAWVKTVKPRPDDIDEWTHYLHDASGNAVAHDRVVGPPRHLQWVGSPRWSRHHDRMASMSALVSSGGRIFYIFDEGSTASIQLPAERMLIARDAFNGTVLWKQPISSWHTHMWPFKSGPAQLPRRLVAVGNRVFVTLGIEAPLTALDAATGEIVRTYEETAATEEVIASDGVLFLLVNESREKREAYKPVHRKIGEEKKRVATVWPWDEKQRILMAVLADTGEILWKKKKRVIPLTLAADRERVFFHDGEKVVCLNRKNGDEIWRSSPVARQSSISTAFAPTLVVYQDVVLFSGGKMSLTALSAESGKELWTSDKEPSGHNSPEDVLVVDGLVWAGATAKGKDSGIFTGWDPLTGEVKKQFPPDVETHWFHQRCYRSKATDRYLLPSRTGIEFVDTQTEHWVPHHWVRGGCIYGIMPCNGLVYTPPHSCACYIDAKLNGFCALAPESTTRQASSEVSEDNRLDRGPAYGRLVESLPASPIRNEWPTYRCDSARSGFTEASVPTDLKPLWHTDLGGRLSSVVVAEDMVFVASIDTHTLHALDADSGKRLWNYTAGGRVDSPPTIYQGQVLFGAADGWVYSLRASDGQLVWRYRAAPMDLRMTAFEQLESAWPVHGNVLVQDGTAYCVAGRSMFLDGGMRLCLLDPKTGRRLSETILDDCDPDSGQNLQVKVKGLNMPTALPDILSSDGRHVYMRTQRFDLQGIRQEVGPTDAANQKGEGTHLFCGAGFLDGSWFHRAYWVYGKAISSGAGGWFRAGRFAPAGRLLVVDDSSVYGYSRKPEYYKWSTPLEYHLFATPKKLEVIKTGAEEGTKRDRQRKKRRGGPSAAFTTQFDCHWSQESPLLARAMVLADKTLFIAGPPDLVDEEEAFDSFGDTASLAKLDEQAAALDGKSGALLWVVSAVEGKKLAEYDLESSPVWDGMAAAYGRLYFSTESGRVLCMGRN